MRDKKEIEIALKRYLPEGYEALIIKKLFEFPTRFKITKPRKSKLGDFRPGINGKPHQITINGNLNKYQFLITALHEFAHLETYVAHGNSVQPHGKEWKAKFNTLLTPLANDPKLPIELRQQLGKNAQRIKAASCNDTALYRVLKSYDKKINSEVLLEELENNAHFYLGNRLFERGILKRTRYLCREVDTQRQFLVHRLAEVKPKKNE
jgi:SprT protein